MKQIKLYDYQQDMMKRIMEELGDHHSIMVQMPTGTGKTHLLAAIVAQILSDDGDKKWIWIVAHRKELVQQIEDTIKLWVEEKQQPQVKAMSIQWLSKHYEEMTDSPAMIIIDEAHHALAESYSSIMKAFPEAKKLGLTATPCRLNRKGFKDLFDELLTSYPILEFIKKGYLSCFDYLSIRPDSEDQKLIDSLQKRGADGDYQVKEMGEKLNTIPTIERLYKSVFQHAKDKKGIVYAIDIHHAQQIAAYYTEHGIKSVAIDCNTPASLRKAWIEQFKNSPTASTNDEDSLQVLVNVDIFSEGFDCPDVEFIQLARPTLSLTKYLQMVGRGLRKVKGKESCVILDQVGLYKRFGLPIMPWDWQGLFKGKYFKKRITDYRNLLVKGPVWRGDDYLQYFGKDDSLMLVLNHQKLNQLVIETMGGQDDKELAGMKIVRKQGDYAVVSEYENEACYGIYSLKEKRMIVPPQFCNKVVISQEDTAMFKMQYGGRMFYDLKSDYSVELYSNEKLPVKVVSRGIFSLLRFNNNCYKTRTRVSYCTGMTLEEADIEEHGFYLTLYDRFANRDMLVCLIANDEEQYYWLAGTTTDGSIYVIDHAGGFYQVMPDATKVPVDKQMVKNAFDSGKAKSFFNYSAIDKLAAPVKIGSKWGLKLDGKLVVVPKYRKIVSLSDRYFAFEDLPMQWGILNASGKVIAQPRYSKITLQDDGIAVLESANGKTTQLICM